MPDVSDPVPAHVLDAAAALRQLGSDAQRGLTAAEAAARLHLYGPNELSRERPPPAWRVLLRQFQDLLILILMGAIGLSALLGHALEAVAIGVIATFAILLGFVQEFRAQRAVDALRQLAAPRAHVVRDGGPMLVAAREVVPGDVLILAQGDVVAADARLIETVDLQAAEAALTGESVAVEKDATARVAVDAALGDRRTMVFAATAITRGRARALAVATGDRTEVGRIGQLLAGIETGATPLEKQLSRLAKWLVRAGAVVVGLVVLLGALRGQALGEMVLFGIALAVAVVPEALPAVVTISLALGAQRMAKRKALIRRLPVVETLGSTTCICTDKTGTLTAGEMVVTDVVFAGQHLRVSGTGYAPEGGFEPPPQGQLQAALDELLAGGALCNDAWICRDPGTGLWHVDGDPTEVALLTVAGKRGLHRADLEGRQPRRHELPFSSERKRMTTLHGEAGTLVAYSKGAPEVVLATCSQVVGPHGREPLTAEAKRAVEQAAADLAAQGMRVLAIASRHPAEPQTAEADMVLLGLLGLRDPPRPEAKAAIQACHHAGIRPVLITGDHAATAQAIAAELGILQGGRVVSGPELEAMTEPELAQAVPDIQVYARVSPAHKLRIVTALQGRGEVVAMTGDGVNDAPALRKADIGIAMGVTGTDVARQAAGMMLADDNFATIVAAIEEGRAIFDNIRKYLIYLLSTNFGEIALIAGSMLLALPLPLSAVQILYVNLASDGLPALALAVDPHERDILRRPPRLPGHGLIDRPVVVLMLLGGVGSALANLAVFGWAMRSGRPLELAMTMTFASLILIQFVKAYIYRSVRHAIWRRPFENRWLNLAVAWEVLLLLAILYVPLLQRWFGTQTLGLVEWAVVLVAALSPLPLLEGAKAWLRRNRPEFGEVAAEVG